MSEIRIVSNYRKRLAKFGITRRANTSHYLALVVKLEKYYLQESWEILLFGEALSEKKKKKKTTGNQINS